MFFEYLWILAAIVVANLALAVVMLAKMHKQEQFQTGEAHANLELINQSLNRLSDIAEKLERAEMPTYEKTIPNTVKPEPEVAKKTFEPDNNRIGQSKEQRAISLIKQGEDPRKIGRKLGISKSEIELLVASEKLGNTRFNDKAKMHV